MKKATTSKAAAKTLMNGAKIAKIGEIEANPDKKTSGIFFAFSVGSAKPHKPRYTKPQAVRELEELADIENQRKHPHTPAKYLAKSKYRDDTANGLTRCIVDYIKLHGGQAERINTIGIPIDTRREVTDIVGHRRTIGSMTWRPSGATVGSADISATIKRRSVKIEVKIGRDRQSETQKAYQKQVEAAGGLYFIAKDFTSFVRWYRATF